MANICGSGATRLRRKTIYEQQMHAAKRLSIVIPITLLLILLILYFQFKSVIASLIHFSGVFVAFAGGFIAFFGVSTDDGVLMGTYIHQTFQKRHPQTRDGIKEAAVET